MDIGVATFVAVGTWISGSLSDSLANTLHRAPSSGYDPFGEDDCFDNLRQDRESDFPVQPIVQDDLPLGEPFLKPLRDDGNTGGVAATMTRPFFPRLLCFRGQDVMAWSSRRACVGWVLQGHVGNRALANPHAACIHRYFAIARSRGSDRLYLPGENRQLHTQHGPKRSKRQYTA